MNSISRVIIKFTALYLIIINHLSYLSEGVTTESLAEHCHQNLVEEIKGGYDLASPSGTIYIAKGKKNVSFCCGFKDQYCINNGKADRWEILHWRRFRNDLYKSNITALGLITHIRYCNESSGIVFTSLFIEEITNDRFGTYQCMKQSTGKPMYRSFTLVDEELKKDWRLEASLAVVGLAAILLVIILPCHLNFRLLLKREERNSDEEFSYDLFVASSDYLSEWPGIEFFRSISEEFGYKIYIPQLDLKGGEYTRNALLDAMVSSRRVLIVLSRRLIQDQDMMEVVSYATIEKQSCHIALIHLHPFIDLIKETDFNGKLILEGLKQYKSINHVKKSMWENSKSLHTRRLTFMEPYKERKIDMQNKIKCLFTVLRRCVKVAYWPHNVITVRARLLAFLPKLQPADRRRGTYSYFL